MSYSEERAERARRLRWIVTGGLALAVGSTGTCFSLESFDLPEMEGVGILQYAILLAYLAGVGVVVAILAAFKLERNNRG